MVLPNTRRSFCKAFNYLAASSNFCDLANRNVILSETTKMNFRE